NKVICRYKFPKELQEESSVSDSEGYMQYCPKRDDPWLCRYNPLISQIWRANTDFSPIASKEAVLRYIAKYASKGEIASTSYKELLNDIISTTDDDSFAKR